MHATDKKGSHAAPPSPITAGLTGCISVGPATGASRETHSGRHVIWLTSVAGVALRISSGHVIGQSRWAEEVETVTTRDQYLVEIADCLDGAHRLQSRVMELTEHVYRAAGMTTADRALRGKVTGLLFGLLANLEELNRLVKEET
jgi:hypothetical protein